MTEDYVYTAREIHDWMGFNEMCDEARYQALVDHEGDAPDATEETDHD